MGWEGGWGRRAKKGKAGRGSRVMCGNTSYHIYRQVMSRVGIRHIIHLDKSCHVWEYVISTMYVTHGNTTYHISQQVMSREWMSCTNYSDVCSPAQHESTSALTHNGAAIGLPAAPSGNQDEYWGIIYTYARTHVHTSSNALQLQLGTPLPLQV